MILCYSIPTQGAIKTNVGNSLYTWQKEDVSPIFDDAKAYWADFYSDLIWVNMAVTEDSSAFHGAVTLPWKQNGYQGDDQNMQYLIQALYYPDDGATSTADYSRYWMLSVGVLKILFNFMQIGHIRYLYWMFTASLMLLVLYYLYREVGVRASIALFIAMLMRNWLLHTASISTAADIIVTLLGLLTLLLFYSHRQAGAKITGGISIIFTLIGSLSFALGPLVAPVMTICIPLIVEIMLESDRDSDKQSWCHIFAYTIAWVFGYAGTMAFKSILSLLVEGRQTASSTVAYYLGPGQSLLMRVNRVVYCLHGLMKPMAVKLPFVFCLVVILIILAYKRGVRPCLRKWELLFVALYPVFWTLIVVEHSKHYFAANNYSGLVFGLLCIALYSIGSKKRKSAVPTVVDGGVAQKSR